MGEYVLKTDDFKQIEDLIKITSSIDVIYTKLYKLEIQGKKESDEYKKILNYLKTIIDIENQKYSSCNLNYFKCQAWVNFLLEKKAPKGFISNIQSIMTQNYDKRIIRRILRILICKMESDKDSLKDILPENILGIVEDFDEDTSDKILSQALYSSLELENAFEKDFYNSYLYILEEMTYKKENNIFRNRLINSKYNLIFINKEIENNMIENNFNIPKDLYINSRFVADLVQMELSLYEFLKVSYGVKICTQQISELLEMRDIDYNDQVKASSSVIRQCFIRTGFMMLNDAAIKDMNIAFEELIIDKKYISEHPNNKISEHLILDSFKYINKDKDKQKILSLGYRNQ